MDSFKSLKEDAYQVTVHELLHLLGLDHCIYFACLMNGSGSLEEDHRQAHIHPVTHEKSDLHIPIYIYAYRGDNIDILIKDFPTGSPTTCALSA